MYKEVYVAEMVRKGGDAYDIGFYDTLAEAVSAAKQDKQRHTDAEIKKAVWRVSGYVIPCADGLSIKEAFRDYVLDCCWTPDPLAFKEV